jgi:flavodoxin
MITKIVYCTKTHHSQKIAEAIAEGLKLTAENVNGKPILKKVDLLLLIGGIYGSKSLPEMIQFVESLDQDSVKKVALVTSCVSNRIQQTAVRNLLMNKGIIVVDEFVCKGSFLFFGLGHPNKTDLENAVKYAKEVTGVIAAQSK